MVAIGAETRSIILLYTNQEGMIKRSSNSFEVTHSIMKANCAELYSK